MGTDSVTIGLFVSQTLKTNITSRQTQLLPTLNLFDKFIETFVQIAIMCGLLRILVECFTLGVYLKGIFS